MNKRISAVIVHLCFICSIILQTSSSWAAGHPETTFNKYEAVDNVMLSGDRSITIPEGVEEAQVEIINELTGETVHLDISALALGSGSTSTIDLSEVLKKVMASPEESAVYPASEATEATSLEKKNKQCKSSKKKPSPKTLPKDKAMKNEKVESDSSLINGNGASSIKKGQPFSKHKKPSPKARTEPEGTGKPRKTTPIPKNTTSEIGQQLLALIVPSQLIGTQNNILNISLSEFISPRFQAVFRKYRQLLVVFTTDTDCTETTLCQSAVDGLSEKYAEATKARGNTVKRLDVEAVFVYLPNKKDVKVAQARGFLVNQEAKFKYTENYRVLNRIEQKVGNHHFEIGYFRYMKKMPEVPTTLPLVQDAEEFILAAFLLWAGLVLASPPPPSLQHVQLIYDSSWIHNFRPRKPKPAENAFINVLKVVNQFYLDPVDKFCLYEGPIDLENYWQNFRLLIEDHRNIKFYYRIQESWPGNTFTCVDMTYKTKVQLHNVTDFKQLEDMMLFEFAFKTPQKFRLQMAYDAKDQKLPLLLYLRETFDGGIGEAEEEFDGAKYRIDFAMYESYQELLGMHQKKREKVEKEENGNEDHELFALKRMLYTWSDLGDYDIGVKKFFESLDIPIYDHMLPCLFIIDYDRESGRQLVYSYPAKDSYAKFSTRQVIDDPHEITSFVLDFFQGNLRPVLRNEDIAKTYQQFPALRDKMEGSLMKRVNAWEATQLALDPTESNFIVFVCELHWAPCIDKFNQINEFLIEEQSLHSKLPLKVYYLDIQYNHLFHRRAWKQYILSYTIFGVMYKLGEHTAYSSANSTKSEDGSWTSLDDSLDGHIEYTLVDFHKFKKLWRFLQEQ